MFSFSDAHETRDIPILASNVQRLVPVRANQIWAVLRPGDSAQQLGYSLACTFLGRMCISGDVHNLRPSQWNIALQAQRLYREVAPIIADGTSRRFGPDQPSYRHPKGWQAVLRVSGKQALAVVHTFADAPAAAISIPLPAGTWRIAGSLHAERKPPTIRTGHLLVKLPGEYRGCVVHLVKR